MSVKRWLRILVVGVAWAAIYNSAWGVAWFSFMGREWLEATVARGRPFPWTPEFWVVWLPLTLPFGVAIAAYIASRLQSAGAPEAVLTASLIVWVPSTIGMATWGWQESLSARVIAVDSAMNLVAMLAASLVVGVSLRAGAARQEPTEPELE